MVKFGTCRAKLGRGDVLVPRESGMMPPAWTVGGDNRTLFSHILPDVLSPQLAIGADAAAVAIVVGARRSSLARGRTPLPSLVVMVVDSEIA